MGRGVSRAVVGVTRASLSSGASALLLALSAPPSPLPLLVFVALVPLAGALDRLVDPASTPHGTPEREGLRLGAVFGTLYWGLTLVWIPQVAPRVGLWVVGGWAAVVLTLAGVTAFAGWSVVRLRRMGVPLALAFGLGWGGIEFVRSAWLGPLSFPWMGVALPLAGIPVLMQGAAWVGEAGIAVALCTFNGWIAASLRAPARRRGRVWAAGVVVVAIVAAAGALRIERLETERVARLLVLQPDVSLAVKRGDPDEAHRRSVATIDALVADIVAAGASRGEIDAVVLPETAVPAVIDGPGAADTRRAVSRWSSALAAPVLVGAFAEGRGRGSNALFLASTDPEERWPVARKVRLVPGVEWTPRPQASVEPGRAPTPLRLPNGAMVGPLICLESAYADLVRGLVASGVRAIVNVTNDAWLAEAPWWTRSAAFHQHPAHLAWRTVESGLGAVRVGNNGRTERIDPFGGRRLLVPPHAPGWEVVEVTSMRDPPGPSWAAWWMPRIAACAALFGGLAPIRRPVDRPRAA